MQLSTWTAKDGRTVAGTCSTKGVGTVRTSGINSDSSHIGLEPLEARVLMSVTIDAAGWTRVDPSSDTRVIYVSSSAGKDSNSGLSPNDAVRSLDHAKELVRDGKPDWILLKRGDVWYESLGKWEASGRSQQEPMLISSYGKGARPLLRTGSDRAISSLPQHNVSHLAIIGLAFHAHTRDPDSGFFSGASGTSGVRWLASGSNLLIEDVVIDSYTTNMVIQSSEGFENFQLRRSTIVDAYSTGGHSQGMFIQNIHGILLEENLFDHNGWNDQVRGAEATIFNHNVYVQADTSGLIARGNIFARASSHGMQARSGGIVADNLFVQNPLGLSYGLVRGGAVTKGLVSDEGVSGTVARNVFLDGNDITPSLKRGVGLEIANLNGVIIADNLFAQVDTDSTTARAINIETDLAGGVRDTRIENNVIYNWRGGVRIKGPASELKNVTFTHNAIQNFDRKDAMIRVDEALPASRMKFENNLYHHELDDAFRIGSKRMAFADWMKQIGERNSREQLLAMPASNRDVGRYNAWIGGVNSLEAFLRDARAAGGATGLYMARAVNQFVRAGHGLDDFDALPPIKPAPPRDEKPVDEKPQKPIPISDPPPPVLDEDIVNEDSVDEGIVEVKRIWDSSDPHDTSSRARTSGDRR